MNEISSTYSSQKGGYDIITFFEQKYQIPVISDPNHETIRRIKNEYRCLDCDGILGMSQDSVLYKLFTKIGFSSSYISLGRDPSDSRMVEASRIHHVNCEPHVKGLCTTTGSISFGTIHYNGIRIEIDPSMSGIILPPQIYDEYMMDKNIYSMEKHHSDWDSIVVRSFDSSFWRTKNMKINEEEKEWTEEFEYNLHPDNFVFYSKTGTKLLGIKRGDENGFKTNYTITLGDTVLRKMLIERSGDELFLTDFNTFDDIDAWNLLLFSFQWFFLLRWTVVNLNIYDLSLDWNLKYSWFEIIFEWTAVVISFVAILLPDTLDLLDTHEDIYIGSWVLLGFGIFLKIFLKIYYLRRDKINYFIHRYKDHYLRLIDSFLEHVILLTGLWILVLQSRTEGGNSPLLFLINVTMLFIIGSYFVISILDIISLIIIQTRPPEKNYYEIDENVEEDLDKTKRKISIDKKNLPNIRKEGLLFLFFVTLAFAYQGVVTLNFFARPLFIKDLNLPDSYNIPLLILLYFFTLYISIVVADLILDYSIVKWKKDAEKRRNDRLEGRNLYYNITN